MVVIFLILLKKPEKEMPEFLGSRHRKSMSGTSKYQLKFFRKIRKNEFTA